MILKQKMYGLRNGACRFKANATVLKEMKKEPVVTKLLETERHSTRRERWMDAWSERISIVQDDGVIDRGRVSRRAEWIRSGVNITR